MTCIRLIAATTLEELEKLCFDDCYHRKTKHEININYVNKKYIAIIMWQE